tara:strand:- start:478 stop:951 length:474 start_codon:yes stop_codon:yes gene_type:complete
MINMKCGCPGTMVKDFSGKKKSTKQVKKNNKASRIESELRQWPLQLHLVGPGAPYFDDADLLICADCVPFAYANFHQDFLKEKAVVIGCPKLDDVGDYVDNIAEIIKTGSVKSVSVLHMEVPCCFGLQSIAEQAVEKSGKSIPIKNQIITINGKKQK